jgi:hypothetical protein
MRRRCQSKTFDKIFRGEKRSGGEWVGTSGTSFRMASTPTVDNNEHTISVIFFSALDIFLKKCIQFDHPFLDYFLAESQEFTGYLDLPKNYYLQNERQPYNL